MVTPLLCVILFSFLGFWIVVDETPGYLLLNFPEILGRLIFIGWYYVVTAYPIVFWHTRLMPIRSILFYSDMIAEVKLMGEIPLGGVIDD